MGGESSGVQQAQGQVGQDKNQQQDGQEPDVDAQTEQKQDQQGPKGDAGAAGPQGPAGESGARLMAYDGVFNTANSTSAFRAATGSYRVGDLLTDSYKMLAQVIGVQASSNAASECVSIAFIASLHSNDVA